MKNVTDNGHYQGGLSKTTTVLHTNSPFFWETAMKSDVIDKTFLHDKVKNRSTEYIN
jgi:hypothetical protein